MKQNILGIEFVCTANSGRSPMAETIGKDYVNERNLDDKIKIYSSGSAVFEVLNFKSPVRELMGYIEIGLKNETYHGKALKMAQEIARKKEQFAEAIERNPTARAAKRMIDMVKYCTRYLMADEAAKRNIVLLEKGLVPDGQFHQQTDVREDVDLILAMKESNAQTVKEIYRGSIGSIRIPIIMPICKYAGIEGAISDPFGDSIDEYRKARDAIDIAVRKSIDRAVKEYNLMR